ncbi:putative membrane protein YhhN [Williamsia limnetica]|uniref:Putative membrane protein YhhN n=1 Tax=Williamsia limnetica TaxID=882452 RepID=A0A318REJ6_WILLI|nr:lysoplasmalogenase family protein [Williamsia limnetica]PYE13738.1 putative membrane protein YhhN [Williamsia limnetica]
MGFPGWKLPERKIFVAATVAVSVAGAARRRPGVAATKPAALAALAVTVARGARHRSAPDNALLSLAVGASAAGDYFMYREEFATGPDKDRSLQTGATLFGLAHLAYLGLLIRHGGVPTTRRLLPRLAVMNEVAVLVILHQPRMLPVLGIYGGTLATMAATAADPALLRGADTDATRLLAAGGIAFMASDAILMNRRYLLRGAVPRAIAEATVLSTYFIAQMLLLDGMDALSRRSPGP